jgi:hypothetical protein
MSAQEPDQLPADLQARDVRVQIQPVHALDLERHMPIEDVVDVRHARHRRMVNAKDGLCPSGRPARDGGEAGRGA